MAWRCYAQAFHYVNLLAGAFGVAGYEEYAVGRRPQSQVHVDMDMDTDMDPSSNGLLGGRGHSSSSYYYNRETFYELLSRAFTCAVDYGILFILGKFPLAFFLGTKAGTASDPFAWRREMGFSERELIVRSSSGRGATGQLMVSSSSSSDPVGTRMMTTTTSSTPSQPPREHAAADPWVSSAFFQTRVIPYISPSYLAEKSGFLMENKEYTLEYGLMVAGERVVRGGSGKDDANANGSIDLMSMPPCVAFWVDDAGNNRNDTRAKRKQTKTKNRAKHGSEDSTATDDASSEKGQWRVMSAETPAAASARSADGKSSTTVADETQKFHKLLVSEVPFSAVRVYKTRPPTQTQSHSKRRANQYRPTPFRLTTVLSRLDRSERHVLQMARNP